MMDSNIIYNRYKEELFKQLKKHLYDKAYICFCRGHKPKALDNVLKGDIFRHYSNNYNQVTKHTLALMLQRTAVLLWSSTPYANDYEDFVDFMIDDDTVLWDSSKSIIKIKYNKEI